MSTVRREDAVSIHSMAKAARSRVQSGDVSLWSSNKINSNLSYLRKGQNLSDQGIEHLGKIPDYRDEIQILEKKA